VHDTYHQEYNTIDEPTETEGGYMSTREVAQAFIKAKAIEVRKEVSFIVEVDSDGNEYYFVEPWDENEYSFSRNRSIKITGVEKVSRYPRATGVSAHGHVVTEQHHYGPAPEGYTSLGKVDDAAFAYKYGIKVTHHGPRYSNSFDGSFGDLMEAIMRSYK
jgi:hypothetical protein